MEGLQIFENPEFGAIRTIEIDGEPWFVGKDVCAIFGDTNYRRSLSRVDEIDKNVSQIATPGGVQQMTIINESGLYALLFQMQPQKGKGVSQNEHPSETVERIQKLQKFKRWVTHEVLPTLRKTGGYISNSDIFIQTYFDDLPEEQKSLVRTCLQSIEEKQKKIKTLETENDLLAQKALEWADRPMINSIVRAYGHSMGDQFDVAWRDFKKELLYQHSINLNSRITAYLNKTGKRTKPKTLEMLDDSELPQALSTAVALCRERNVDISSILEKKAG